MVKKILAFFGAVIAAAALVCGGLWFVRENYIAVNGHVLWRHTRGISLEGYDLDHLEFLQEFTRLQTMDARSCDLTPEQYEHLCRSFPGVEVVWEVPFQGKRYSTHTEKITVTSLSEADVQILDYFPELKSVDGWDCDDYEQLLELQQRRPGCKVFYDVPVAGALWDCDMEQLQLENVDLQELSQQLQYLPNVHTLHLTGALPRMEDLQALLQKYPKVAISWQVDVGETALELGADYLDLSGYPVENAEQIENLIPYLPALREVNLVGCSVPAEEVAGLAEQYPDIHFICDVTIGTAHVRSDAWEMDLSGHEISDPALLEAVLPCFRNLKRVIMCGCGIPSEEMDQLSKRYPDIRFVWSVNLGGLEVRTDATYFIPTKYDVKVSSRDLVELKYCVDMLCVDVGHMKDVTNCEWAAYMPKLKYLVLADTRVRDITPLTGLKDLVFVELFLTAVKDYSPLLTCTGLEDLNLCYTHGDPEPVTRIIWLKRLWWSGDWKARAKYGDTFRENNPDGVFNFTTGSSTGEGWREGKHYYAMRDLIGMSYMTW